MNHLNELQEQKIALRMLTTYLKSGIPPLLIFHGPDGTGKWSAAEAFIRQRLCITGNGCGNCPSCRKIEKGSHPDIIQFPEDKIAIGDVKDPEEFTVRWLIRTRLCYSPFDGPTRFVLFPAADKIQNEAETALLKTLEETPDHTRFIFLIRDISDLKATIVSRGVLIPFHPLPVKTLKKFGDVPDEYLDILGGSMHLFPFLQTELFRVMTEKIEAAFLHPLAMHDLEQWVHAEDKKNFAGLLGDEEYSKDELIDIFALLLLRAASKMERRTLLWRKIFDFKRDLHKDLSGIAPYLLSRLFHDLSLVLFPE